MTEQFQHRSYGFSIEVPQVRSWREIALTGARSLHEQTLYLMFAPRFERVPRRHGGKERHFGHRFPIRHGISYLTAHQQEIFENNAFLRLLSR